MKLAHLEKIRSLAIVGATGLVGEELLSILEDLKIHIPRIGLFASEKSIGKALSIGDREIPVDALEAGKLNDYEAVFFSVNADLSRKFIPALASQGAIVIDDSSAFRLEPQVPLVVPEVNGEQLKEFDGGVVSIPNCTVTPLVLTLKPLAQFGIKRVVVSTYQSVSGAGRLAFEELGKQTMALMNGQQTEVNALAHRIAFNCLPQIGPAAESGNCEEEEKMIHETRKILEQPDLGVSATTVRVPTFCGHGLSVNVEFETDPGSPSEIREQFDSGSGVKIIDQPQGHIYPTNIECTKSDDTFVGRVRRDESVRFGINYWVVSDNLRKGAALNALQILDKLYGYRALN